MKAAQETLTNRSKYSNVLLRGLAIVAVVILHTMSNLGSDTYLEARQHIFSIPIDQLCRFAVPMFVMLSGYAFWAKFSQSEWSWKEYFNTFLFRQVQKLLPLYLLTCVIFLLLFRFYWGGGGSSLPLWHQFVFGRADYHLYFMSMIFQMYLLFPLFFWCMKKRPWATVVVTFLFQLVLYYFFSSSSPHWLVRTYFAGDQEQYIWFFTWVWYAILGMALARFPFSMLTRKTWLSALLILSLTTWILASWNSISLVNQGINPVNALSGARVPILFYATMMCIFLFSSSLLINDQLRKFFLPLKRVGDWSYVIYLWHTMVLRFIFV